VDYIDICCDPIPEHKYKESEDPTQVVIHKTRPQRGPLSKEKSKKWIDECKTARIPIMCSYKIVRTKFELWGLQTKVEAWSQKAIRDILLLAHRQAFCWIDEWYDMSYELIVNFEKETYAKTNEKVLTAKQNNNDTNDKKAATATPTSSFSGLRSYFSGFSASSPVSTNNNNNDKKNVEDF
jgi:hypothetical protein